MQLAAVAQHLDTPSTGNIYESAEDKSEFPELKPGGREKRGESGKILTGGKGPLNVGRSAPRLAAEIVMKSKVDH